MGSHRGTPRWGDRRAQDRREQHSKTCPRRVDADEQGIEMSRWKNVGLLSAGLAALSLSACSTGYDCSNTDVTDMLVEQAANSGYTPYMKEVPAEWGPRLVNHTALRNVVTLDKNEEIGHFRCKANLEYREGDRSVTSKDITYEVRKIEGEADFTLEWEVEHNGIGPIDPIKMFALDVQGPWKGELEKQQAKDYQEKLASHKEEVRAWALQYATEYASKHPPIPFGREALKQHADEDLARLELEPVMEQFHDIDGDGFLDYFTIVANREFNEGEFAEETENYGQYTNTGGFMRRTYFFRAVTQPFKGFGLETNMGLQDLVKVTTAEGEKVADKYLPRDVAKVAKAPLNPIAGVAHVDGAIVVSLVDGQSVTIDKFKPEKPLAEIQQDRMRDLQDRLTLLRENNWDIARLYE